MEIFCNSTQFSLLAGIVERVACRALSRAFEGHTWRGHHLVVCKVRSQGGNAGWSYEVRLDSLPQELQDAWRANPVPAVPGKNSPLEIEERCPVSHWRYGVIKEALKHPSKTAEKTLCIRRLSDVVREWPSGRRSKISERTIRLWIDAYEKSGMTGLRPGKRSDCGESRVHISREWDAGVPFGDDIKTGIAGNLGRDVRSLWAANTSYGWNWVARYAGDTLQEMTVAAGFDPGLRMLKSLCAVPRGFIERHRDHRALAIYDKDRKHHFDHSMPRIMRTRAGRNPMEIVVGDVHPLDIYLRRPDGSVYAPRIIAWHDWATNRVFSYPVFLPKGRGVRQEHVIESYIAMVTHPEWGVPEVLYIDNGGEYNATTFIDDAQKLNTEVRILGDDQAMTDALKARRTTIVKARPYNASAKAIEGLFGVLEGGVFSMLPGWIGGNRMRKKTANVGKEPEPYPFDEERFRQSLATMLEAYETHPQSGTLGGRSPRQAFTEAVANGWRRMDADPLALLAAFAFEKKRVVHQGGFSYGGKHYTARKIQRLSAGTRLLIRVPIVGDRSALPVLGLDGKFLCIAELNPQFDALDKAGAQEAAARNREHNAALAEMRKNVDPVDLEARARKLIAKEAPAPTPESAGLIQWDETLERIGREAALTPKERKDNQTTQHERDREKWRRDVALLKNPKRAIGGNQ